MACSVAITAVAGVGSPPSFIGVSGNASGCDTVRIMLKCNGFVTTATAPVSGGGWSAQVMNVPCDCGENVSVTVDCLDADCSDHWEGPLECESACTVTILTLPHAQTSNGVVTLLTVSGKVTDCDTPVTVTVECTGGMVLTKQALTLGEDWQVTLGAGDGLQSAGCGCEDSLTVTATCGQVDPVTGQAECQDQYVGPPDCASCALVFQQDVGDCNPNETRPVSLIVTLTPANPGPVSFYLEKDGQFLDSCSGMDQCVLAYGPEDWSEGSYVITVVIEGPEACTGGPTLNYVVDVKSCRETGACCLPDGTCRQLTAEECKAAGGEFQGIDTRCEDVDCPPKGSGGGGDEEEEEKKKTDEKEKKGDCTGILVIALAALCAAFITQALVTCIPPGPAYIVAQIGVALLWATYAVLMSIVTVMIFFGLCDLSWCLVAKFHVLFLGPTGLILGLILLAPCAFQPMGWIYAIKIGLWGTLWTSCEVKSGY